MISAALVLYLDKASTGRRIIPHQSFDVPALDT